MSFALVRMPLVRADVRDTGPPTDEVHQWPAETLVRYARALAADPVFREAVTLASTALSRDLDRIENDETVDLRQLRRVVVTLTKYHLRATTRPTPFGLFTGVASTTFGDTPHVRIGAAHVKHVRPDRGWLHSVVKVLEAQAPVLLDLRLIANNLHTFRGDRLVLPYVRTIDEQIKPGTPQEVAIPATSAVREALSRAATAIPYGELVAQLHETCSAALPQVQRLIAFLVRHEALLTDLVPESSGADPLIVLAHRLATARLPGAEAVGSAEQAVTRYADARMGNGRALLNRTIASMRQLHEANNVLHVDTRMDADIQLPPVVTAEVAAAANALWRISPDGRQGGLNAYHQTFVERYGYHQAVPLRELLDPHRGLDAPAGYIAPLSQSIVPAPGREPDQYAARFTDLAELTQRALHDGEELVIDENMLRLLASADGLDPPPFVEVRVRLLASSVAAMAGGDFRVVFPAIGGTNCLGAYTGRFGLILPEVAASLTKAIGDWGRHGGGPAPAQLRYRPRVPRMANVTQTPSLTDYMIAVGTSTEPTDPTVLGLDDILIVAEPGRLYPMSRSLGRELAIVSADALNTEQYAPNVVRLLRELGLSGRRPWHCWEWGALSALPRLPRVRFGRSILCAARWRPDRPLLEATRGGDWAAGLDAWRRRWDVPDHVRAGDADQMLELNLGNPLHRQVLRDELVRRPATVVEEAFDPAGLGWSDGRHAELVMPLAATRREGNPRSSTPARRERSPRPSDARDWTYLKLHCTSTTQDDVLTRYLDPLIEVFSSQHLCWFFVRYVDHVPHLRLRVRSRSADVREAVEQWARNLCDEGVARSWSFAPFEPEVDRYGGPGAYEQAEEFFHADSLASIAQLRLLRGGIALTPTLMVAASLTDIIARWETDPDGWFAEHVARTVHHATFQSLRRQACDLIDPGSGWATLEGLDGGSTLLAAWRQRAPALEAYLAAYRSAHGQSTGEPASAALKSLLHMHANRTLGCAPSAEARAMAVARGVAKARQDRRTASDRRRAAQATDEPGRRA